MVRAEKRAMDLYCLPHAGGGASFYRQLEPHLAESIRLRPVELPGRGRRFCEPLLRTIRAMARDTLQQIRGEIMRGGRYGVLGHSMGSCVALELARLIREAGLPDVDRLVVSGRGAPRCGSDHDDWHRLPGAEFREKVSGLGGTPTEILGDESVFAVFEPILRADFQAVETYVYREAEPLEVPITAIVARDDNVCREEVLAWERETRAQFRLIEFESGGHFFLVEHAARFGELVSDTLVQGG